MLRAESITSVLPRFFRENALTISPGTRKKWNVVLRNLQWRYPKRRINELTPTDLTRFLLLDQAGEPRQVCGGTILSRRTVLRSFFGWCTYVGILDKDPSLALSRTVKAKAQVTRQHHWLDAEQVSALFGGCAGDELELRGARDAVILGFGIFCGLRIHEIVKVSWQDLGPSFDPLYVLGKGGKAAQ